MRNYSRYSFFVANFVAICCMGGTAYCSTGNSPTSSDLPRTVASNQQIKDFLEKQEADLTNITDNNVLERYSAVLSETEGAIHEYNSKLGKLNCLIKTNSANPTAIVVVIHGYSANKEQLATVADNYFERYYDVPTAFVIPDSNLIVNENKKEFAWWNIPVDHISDALNTSSYETVLNFEPEGLKSATDDIKEVIEASSKAFDVPIKQFVLFGYSQGAMQMMDVLFNMETYPYLVGFFSGGPMMQEQWRTMIDEMDEERRQQLKQVQVFQYHGVNDDTIPYPGGIVVKILLEDFGLPVEFDETNEGHDLELSSLLQFYSWIVNNHPLKG